MQPLATASFAAFGGALVALLAYHQFAVKPALSRLADAIGAHDGLLGGGAGPATARLDMIDKRLADVDVFRGRTDARIAELERVAALDVHRVGFHRYNAFADTGSDLSYALALLNREGDGVVVSSIWSREETRTYGKSVAKFATVQDASKEELAAIDLARNGA